MNLIANDRERLDRFLAKSLPEFSRTRLAKLIDAGEVLVNGHIQKPSFLLEPGMELTLDQPAAPEPHDLTPASIPLTIVYEDDSMLIVDKPRGLAAHPAASLKEPSLVNALLGRNIELSQAAGAFRPGIVHRLDKETTGLMVVAKNDSAHIHLAKQIEGKAAERRYFAVASGHFADDRFVIDQPIARNKNNRLLMAVEAHGKHSVTHGKLVTRLDQGSLLAIRLETGRTHQIRVHLSAVGHPVLGDTLYGQRPFNVGPLQLHAAYLALDHPVTGERMTFFAGPGDEFLGSAWATRQQIETI